jgi:hypothetical protein
MTFGKAAAALYCAGVLAVQAWVIASTSDYQEYYWPFLNYPMYSRSFEMGGQIRHARLVLHPCDPDQPPIEMTHEHARVTRYEFQYRVHRAAGARKNTTPEGARRARIALTRLANDYVPVRTCRMEVQLKLFRIGRKGLELPGTAWLPYIGWNVRDGTIADPAWGGAEAIRP